MTDHFEHVLKSYPFLRKLSSCKSDAQREWLWQSIENDDDLTSVISEVERLTNELRASYAGKGLKTRKVLTIDERLADAESWMRAAGLSKELQEQDLAESMLLRERSRAFSVIRRFFGR